MNLKCQQRGAAVLIFLTIVLLGITTLLVTELSVNNLLSDRNANTSVTLNQAKQSLIGYALSHTTPGTLPCPDSSGDGLENPAVGGCQTQLGLLPVRTLNLPALTDPTGAALWYGIDLNYSNNAAALKNSSIATTLTLDGQTRAGVIIAPGKAIENQSRRLLNLSDHLEGINANGDSNSYSSAMSEVQNDRALSIEPGPFWSIIEERALAEASTLLNNYRAQCGEYPWAANFGGPSNSVNNQQIGALPLSNALPTNWGNACGASIAPTPAAWLISEWSSQLLYRMCQSVEGNCVSIIDSIDSPAAGVLVAPGIALAGQVRPDTDTADYFEGENTSLPDTQFRRTIPLNHTMTSNDVSQALVP